MLSRGHAFEIRAFLSPGNAVSACDAGLERVGRGANSDEQTCAGHERATSVSQAIRAHRPAVCHLWSGPHRSAEGEHFSGRTAAEIRRLTHLYRAGAGCFEADSRPHPWLVE